MSILARFGDIVSANINALLDKCEDPSKMIDQYMRNLVNDLAEVKKETAGIMAEEARTARLVETNAKEVEKYVDLAKKAIEAGNDGDARTFLTKKQEVQSIGVSLKQSYEAAHANALNMRAMHDKLTQDINALNARRDSIKSKVAVAKTQERVNKIGSSVERANATAGAFGRMEEKADRMLDSANAMAELNVGSVDETVELAEKYNGASGSSVDDELAKMKADLGIGIEITK